MPVFLLRTADSLHEERGGPHDFADLAAARRAATDAAAAQALDRLASGEAAVTVEAFVERPDGSVAGHLGVTLAVSDLHRPDYPVWDAADAPPPARADRP